MTSLSATAAALQLGAYKVQGRPQNATAPGKAGADEFAVADKKPARTGDATTAPRTLVASTESVRIELSNAARAALLQLQTLKSPPGPAKPADHRQPGQDKTDDETNAEAAPLRQWANQPYVAPGSRLNLSI